MKRASLIELAESAELFSGFGRDEIENLLFRFNGVKREYPKNDVLIHAGMAGDRLFVVLSGRLHVYQRILGDREILVREIRPGTVVGLWMLVEPGVPCWPVTMIAVEPCVAISLDMASARRFIGQATPDVARLSANVMRLLSRELFLIWRKLSVASEQNLADRIQIYLKMLSVERDGNDSVEVPFNRERMAEYFGVTRPALSRTLGQMRDDGLIAWRKNIFRINF